MWWLMGTYFLQTLGELLLSPIGLSAMSKLAPDRAAALSLLDRYCDPLIMAIMIKPTVKLMSGVK